jgi:hypothetical protein
VLGWWFGTWSADVLSAACRLVAERVSAQAAGRVVTMPDVELDGDAVCKQHCFTLRRGAWCLVAALTHVRSGVSAPLCMGVTDGMAACPLSRCLHCKWRVVLMLAGLYTDSPHVCMAAALQPPFCFVLLMLQAQAEGWLGVWALVCAQVCAGMHALACACPCTLHLHVLLHDLTWCAEKLTQS